MREVITYVADDGRIFRSKDACAKYENMKETSWFELFDGHGRVIDKNDNFVKRFEYFAVGGEYGSEKMLEFLDKHNIKLSNSWMSNEDVLNLGHVGVWSWLDDESRFEPVDIDALSSIINYCKELEF